MHLAIQALSLASLRHITETKETNISNKGDVVKNLNQAQRQTSWLFSKRDRGSELGTRETNPLVAG